jgi:serine protease AprX
MRTLKTSADVHRAVYALALAIALAAPVSSDGGSGNSGSGNSGSGSSGSGNSGPGGGGTSKSGWGKRGKLSQKARTDAKAKGAAGLDVLVRFHRNPSSPERLLVRGLGGQIRRHHRSRWMAVRLPGHAVSVLADHSLVEFVTVDATLYASMDAARATAGQPEYSEPESGLKGAGVTIAMVDSGVAPHAEIKTLVASVDFVNGADPNFAPEGSVDTNGHGTHVAGIMVGDGSESYEGRLAGIAPQASLVSLRVLDGEGKGQSSSMIAALEWVLAHKDQYGIRVLNLSLGHPVYEAASLDPLVHAVDSLWDAGVVVVCSAGNEGREGHSTISSPCNSRKVITVGALNDHNTLDRADDTIASYSSRGPTRVDRVAKPDLVAPGNRIVSTRSAGSSLDSLLPGGRVAADPSRPDVFEHLEMSGTSMAAPMVSATAALMLQQEPSLNPATIKARLMLSARKAAGGDPFAVGAGVLDILAALRTGGQVAVAPSPLVFADADTGALQVENTGVLWASPEFSLPALWSTGVVWSEASSPEEAVLSSSASLWADTSANCLLWPEATLFSEATLWYESTLWSESVMWSDEPNDAGIASLGLLVADP